VQRFHVTILRQDPGCSFSIGFHHSQVRKRSLIVIAKFLNFNDTIGILAATFTTAAFIPQAWLTWKTKCVDGVSLGMYSVFTAGVALWLAYGMLLGAWPVIAANAVTLALALFILCMKLRFG
jgi:MtN3 and saliva related transmembrane protein